MSHGVKKKKNLFFFKQYTFFGYFFSFIRERKGETEEEKKRKCCKYELMIRHIHLFQASLHLKHSPHLYTNPSLTFNPITWQSLNMLMYWNAGISQPEFKKC